MAEIILNLLESKDAKELSEQKIVHRSQLQKAIKLIEEGIDNAIQNKNETEEHIHEAVTILGTRGSGKTTFLLSLREYFKSDKRIKILNNIYPTLIEEKGHIFLYIISIINDLLVDHFDQKDNDFSKRKKWKELLFRLSHGLPSMDGVGGTLNESDWQDPEFIMEKGLRSVSSARDLAKSFQELVAYALNEIKKDAFLLTFDDIDIDFKKGWNILETIRKYLHTSKIIIILSGDLNLYTLAIRNQYWNSFGRSILENEGDKLGKHSYFNDRITELESQYILKVIKPERRIHLTSLFEKIQIVKSKAGNSDDVFFVRFDSSENPNSEIFEIEECYKKVLSLFGINNKYQSEAYSSFLLSLPLRTQILFLSQFDLKNDSLAQINVIDAFLSDLTEKEVDINLLDSNPQLLNVEVLKLLIREKKLNDLYQLQPVTSDSSLNSSLVSLSLFSSIRIEDNPYLIFDYFIKIGYVRNLLSSIGYNTEKQEDFSNLSPSIEGLCNHSGIFQNKVLRDVASNITSYLKGGLSNFNNKAGIISLPGLADTSRKGSDIVGNRIDRVFRNSSFVQRTVGFIPLSIAAYSTSNRSVPCYSVYALIATIGELIRKCELNDLPSGLLELSEVRTYVIPQFKRGGGTERIESTSYLSEIGSNLEFGGSQFQDSIQTWVSNYRHWDIKVSPHLLGKISTRFYYALYNIENIEDETNLGEMMHRRIIAFLNAILIEDVRENIQYINGFNINNTNLSDEIFIKNLEIINYEPAQLELSRWLISCPLFLFYLNPKTRVINEIRRFLNQPHGDFRYYPENSVYSLLCLVTTRGNKQSRQIRSTTSSNYDRIIEALKDRGTPFSLFEDSDDKMRVRENNDFIRTHLTDLFGENITSGAIRAFRNYIKKSRKEW
jgi:GTPase SAR1 family protein